MEIGIRMSEGKKVVHTVLHAYKGNLMSHDIKSFPDLSWAFLQVFQYM